MKLREYILCKRKRVHKRTGTKTDTEDKKLFNKVIISVFFAHKKYFRNRKLSDLIQNIS